MKKFLSWALPNSSVVGLFMYWQITSSETASNILIFTLWFFIVTGFLTVFFCGDDAFRKMADIPKLFILTKSILSVVYVLALASVGWFWTAAFLCTSSFLIKARIFGARKKNG